MTSPSLRDLHDAIMTNSFTLVQSYLTQGVSLNENMAQALPHWEEVITEDETGHFSVPGDCFVAAKGTGSDFISALHLAVISCYHNSIENELICSALNILGLLLNCGADVSSATQGIKVCNHGSWEHADIENGTTPLRLAIYLKKNLHPVFGGKQAIMMDQVIAALVMAASNSRSHLKPPMCPVPKSVMATWKKLLFSPVFSDVKFVCTDDGSELYAHKCVLSAASDYFHAYFLGPWGESHADGVWKTNNSVGTMKAVLTFIYTGELPLSTLNSPEALTLLCAAEEYNLLELLQLSIAGCIRQLSTENIKLVLRLAHLHESNELQQACFRFVQYNAAACMSDTDFIALATEHPELWNKLTDAISPKAKKRKRN